MREPKFNLTHKKKSVCAFVFCRYTLTFATPYICHHKAFKVQEQPVSHIKCRAFTGAANKDKQDGAKDSAEQVTGRAGQGAADTGANTIGNDPNTKTAATDGDASEVTGAVEAADGKLKTSGHVKVAEEEVTGEQQQAVDDATVGGEGEYIDGDGGRGGADGEL